MRQLAFVDFGLENLHEGQIASEPNQESHLDEDAALFPQVCFTVQCEVSFTPFYLKTISI